MDASIPEGFVVQESTQGFGECFGPIYVDHATRRIGFRVGPQHANPRGVCHGGALSMFADYQITPLLDPDTPLVQAPITISISIDYLGPAMLGSWVEGEAIKLRETKALIFTQIVLSADGEPVARSNGLFRKNNRN